VTQYSVQILDDQGKGGVASGINDSGLVVGGIFQIDGGPMPLMWWDPAAGYAISGPPQQESLPFTLRSTTLAMQQLEGTPPPATFFPRPRPRHRRRVSVVFQFRQAPGSDKVKSLSPHDRFVIALHSPEGIIETGLLVCPSEKKARKLPFGAEGDTFSGPV
jgi:hypothetical protein